MHISSIPLINTSRVEFVNSVISFDQITRDRTSTYILQVADTDCNIVTLETASLCYVLVARFLIVYSCNANQPPISEK